MMEYESELNCWNPSALSLCTNCSTENIFFLTSSAERDCSHNYKGHFVSRVTYPIHNGNNEEDIVIFLPYRKSFVLRNHN